MRKDNWPKREPYEEPKFISGDPRVAAFIARRAVQSMQLRYWSRLGNALPKTRVFKSSR
jgi:hypothetical protein